MIRSVERSTYAVLQDDNEPAVVRSEVFATLDKPRSQVRAPGFTAVGSVLTYIFGRNAVGGPLLAVITACTQLRMGNTINFTSGAAL